jgi:DNA-binding beta-propeller fold protein YncE
MIEDQARWRRPRQGLALVWRLSALAFALLIGLAVYAWLDWSYKIPDDDDASGPARSLSSLQLVSFARGEDGAPKLVQAPELEGGVAWLNCAGPIHLRDLRGKIVILDFWTLCCINCIHTLPDLAKIEKKYPNQVVVIGVHSAKFENEKNSESIRKAILRYEISHPVVNDANMRIWRAYDVQSWPSLFVIDPEGNLIAQGQGEGLYDGLNSLIAKLVDTHRVRKTLNEEPLRFDLARYRERGDSPLYFPGKVLADTAGKRIFIADSTHHRIVITDLEGKKIAIAGTGVIGKADGPFDKAGFNDPQGMALDGDTLYVADRRNNLIRALDLKEHTVKTIAGTGEQGQERRRGGAALTTGLNSPWDLYLIGRTLYIAMAGHHQIWTLDLDRNSLAPFAGTGQEDIADGAPHDAKFAQPSGLTSDGSKLYVADSEVSAVRSVPLRGNGDVESLVGEGLFQFGDVDGVGAKVRLQHALGVAYHDGKLYVADTYNSKIKVIDPAERSCTTYLGSKDKGWLTGPPLNEPGGLSFAGDKMYIADTNNHRICVVDLKTKALSTLALKDVSAPAIRQETNTLSFPNPKRKAVPSATVPREGELGLAVDLNLEPGFKLNPEARMNYLVETLPGANPPWSETGNVDATKTAFQVSVPADKINQSNGLRLSLVYYECGEGSQAICRVKSQIWEVPLKFETSSSNRVIHLSGPDVTKEEPKR